MSRYLKDMVNQTAMSMKVVRLYSGLKQATMFFRICVVKIEKKVLNTNKIAKATQQQPVSRWCSSRVTGL